MPIFREFWAWVIFIGLAAFGTAAAIISADKSGGLWEDLVAIGHAVEPLWVGSAILAYTLTEGATMIADTLKRKQYEAGIIKGKAEGKAQGKAEGKAETFASLLKAAAGKESLTLEDIQRIVDNSRQNGSENLPADA